MVLYRGRRVLCLFAIMFLGHPAFLFSQGTVQDVTDRVLLEQKKAGGRSLNPSEQVIPLPLRKTSSPLLSAEEFFPTENEGHLESDENEENSSHSDDEEFIDETLINGSEGNQPSNARGFGSPIQGSGGTTNAQSEPGSGETSSSSGDPSNFGGSPNSNLGPSGGDLGGTGDIGANAGEGDIGAGADGATSPGGDPGLGAGGIPGLGSPSDPASQDSPENGQSERFAPGGGNQYNGAIPPQNINSFNQNLSGVKPGSIAPDSYNVVPPGQSQFNCAQYSSLADPSCFQTKLADGSFQIKAKDGAKAPKILLDPGHLGGEGIKDGRHEPVGYREGKGTFAVALRTFQIMTECFGYPPESLPMTRQNLTNVLGAQNTGGPNLSARAKVIKSMNPDLFISIHNNGSDGNNAQRTEVYVDKNTNSHKNSTDFQFANTMLEALESQFKTQDTNNVIGLDHSKNKTLAHPKNLSVFEAIRNTERTQGGASANQEIPSILVEGFFFDYKSNQFHQKLMDNQSSTIQYYPDGDSEDLASLNVHPAHDWYAEGLVKGIANYLGCPAQQSHLQESPSGGNHSHSTQH